jgi:hypothetical protein
MRSEITLPGLPSVPATDIRRSPFSAAHSLIELITPQVLMHLDAISRHLLPKCMQELACIGLAAAGEVISFCDTADESIEGEARAVLPQHQTFNVFNR